MARYNTSSGSTSINGTATISSPFQGAFTNLTGTAPYTVTLPNPALFPGTNQTFYNATGGTVTLSTPGGNFVGTGASGTGTNTIFAGNVLSVTSDGTNYVVISEDGSPLIATTGSFSSDVTITGASATVNIQPSSLTLYPGSIGAMDRVAIGVNNRSSGAFTSLAANAQVSFTAGTASTSTSTGSLVVTGGIGASGTVNASSVVATSLTGTLQTASQANITTLAGASSIGPSSTISITAGGGVGINNTSPVTKFDVYFGLNQSTTQKNELVLQARADGTNNAAGALTGITFNNRTIFYVAGSLNSTAGVYGVNTDSGAGGIYGRQMGLALYTSAQDLTATEKVRIGSDGNVGIGTQTPGSDTPWGVPTVDVSGSRGVLVLRTTSATGIATLRMKGPDASFNDDWHINMGAGVNSTISFSPKSGGGGIGLVLKNDGTVGIGISSPATKLHVVQSTPTGLGGVPGNATAILDSNSNNFLLFRNTADNGSVAGMVFQDNNVGGFVVFKNASGPVATGSDSMIYGAYQDHIFLNGSSESVGVGGKPETMRIAQNGLVTASRMRASGDRSQSWLDWQRAGSTTEYDGNYYAPWILLFQYTDDGHNIFYDIDIFVNADPNYAYASYHKMVISRHGGIGTEIRGIAVTHVGGRNSYLATYSQPKKIWIRSNALWGDGVYIRVNSSVGSSCTLPLTLAGRDASISGFNASYVLNGQGMIYNQTSVTAYTPSMSY